VFCSVFLIAATNVYVRFMHFRFGADYAAYLNARDLAAQEALVNDASRDTFVHLQCTKWFNLGSVKGRRDTLCHVLALLRWHDAAAPDGNEMPFQNGDMSIGSSDEYGHLSDHGNEADVEEGHGSDGEGDRSDDASQVDDEEEGDWNEDASEVDSEEEGDQSDDISQVDSEEDRRDDVSQVDGEEEGDRNEDVSVVDSEEVWSDDAHQADNRSDDASQVDSEEEWSDDVYQDIPSKEDAKDGNYMYVSEEESEED
jgi:hypothetical protein